MYAKLIIYQTDSVATDRPLTDALNVSTPVIQASGQPVYWQLTAENLTNSKVAELLLCLDELGFSDEVTGN